MVSLSWGSVGFQGDAGGSVPLGAVATATPSRVSDSKHVQVPTKLEYCPSIRHLIQANLVHLVRLGDYFIVLVYFAIKKYGVNLIG